MKPFLSIFAFFALFLIFNCSLPQDKRVDDRLTKDIKKITGFGIPSKLYIDEASKSLYVFDETKGVYEIDLNSLNFNSDSSLNYKRLYKRENRVRFYNINSKNVEEKTDITFYMVDFAVVNDGGKKNFYAIVKAEFDPDYVSSDNEGDRFAKTDWYYIYREGDLTSDTDFQPLSFIPDNSSDTNYTSDSSSYSAKKMYIAKNALYLSCGSNDKALRYIRLNDDYTIDENFRFNQKSLGNKNYLRIYGTYEGTSLSGIVNSGSVVSTSGAPAYVFLTSKDEGTKGVFIYKDDNPSDFSSVKRLKKTISFPDKVYPYGMSFNPFNDKQIYFSSSNNLYFLDISKINEIKEDETRDIDVSQSAFFSENKSVSNFCIFREGVNSSQKIAVAFYSTETIPDTTEIKFYDIVNKNEEFTPILLEGAVNNMLYYDGYLLATNQSTQEVFIKKL